MGSACSGTSSSAYVEKPPSGIQSNGQYVVDGVVIPRRQLTAAEAHRRGLKEDSWRGSKMGRTNYWGAPGGAGGAWTHHATVAADNPVQQPYRRGNSGTGGARANFIAAEHPVQQPYRR